MVLPSICYGCSGVLVWRHLVCSDTNNYAGLHNHIMKITPSKCSPCQVYWKIIPIAWSHWEYLILPPWSEVLTVSIWLDYSDPGSCDASQASLLDNITPGIKFPPTTRPDLSLCEKSLLSCVSPSRETFSKFAELRVWLSLAMFGMAGWGRAWLWREQTPGLNWVRDGAGPHLTRGGCTARVQRRGENIVISQHHSPVWPGNISDHW